VTFDSIETVLTQHTVDRGWGVDVRSKLRASNSAEQIAPSHADLHPPSVARIHCPEQSSSLIGRTARELLHVRIAADHAIERNDVGTGEFGRGVQRKSA
jgi:hypothetical protein